MKARLVIMGCLLASFAWAHPHVWIYTGFTVLAEEGQMQGLRVHWKFDDMYSAAFLMDEDSNRNGKLEDNEIADVISAVFHEDPSGLAKFLLVEKDGIKQPFTFRNARIWMDGEELNYRFDVILDKLVPLAGNHKIAAFDPEFYISFEQDVAITLPEGTTCTQKLAEDPSILIYMDLVNPEAYTMECA